MHGVLCTGSLSRPTRTRMHTQTNFRAPTPTRTNTHTHSPTHTHQDTHRDILTPRHTPTRNHAPPNKQCADVHGAGHSKTVTPHTRTQTRRCTPTTVKFEACALDDMDRLGRVWKKLTSPCPDSESASVPGPVWCEECWDVFPQPSCECFSSLY